MTLSQDQPALVQGPEWSRIGSKVIRGRFPLSVERFIMSMVAELVPGVTTVTLNARYYSLHTYIALSAKRDGTTDSEAISRLRRAEVVLGAISARHLERSPATHHAYSQPHGYNKIVALMRASGEVDVDALAAPGSYATARQGFMAAYRGSEISLGLVTAGSAFRPGERCDEARLSSALRTLDPLLARDTVSLAELDEHSHLCLCRMPDAEDGAWLAEIFAARGSDSPRDKVRRQTLQMINRSVALTTIGAFSTDLTDFICYAPAAREDKELLRLPLVHHWRGLMLRNKSTSAWRQLWAWLVDEVGGLSTREQVGHALADRLPDRGVRQWRDDLPATVTAESPTANAEALPGFPAAAHNVERWLAVLAVGSRRSHELAGAEFEGFTSRRPGDLYEELSPRWLADQLDAWSDRPLRDFARHLSQVLINRSQRIALAKARPNPRTGVLQIPTRLLTRDEFVFTQGSEGRGNASLRLGQLGQIAAGMGLLVNDGLLWSTGSRGDLLAD